MMMEYEVLALKFHLALRVSSCLERSFERVLDRTC